MNFKLACLIGMVMAAPFGLVFVFLPELTASFYGITNWNAGTLGVARLFGNELLFVAAALYAVRDCTDVRIQQTMARLFSLASLVGCVITVQAAISGSTNNMMWSTVGIYVFLMLMWGSVGFRSKA